MHTLADVRAPSLLESAVVHLSSLRFLSSHSHPIITEYQAPNMTTSDTLQDVAESDIQTNYHTISGTFDEMSLKEPLLRGIYAMGFEKPSAIQQRAILPIIKEKDVIAQAQMVLRSMSGQTIMAYEPNLTSPVTLMLGSTYSIYTPEVFLPFTTPVHLRRVRVTALETRSAFTSKIGKLHSLQFAKQLDRELGTAHKKSLCV